MVPLLRYSDTVMGANEIVFDCDQSSFVPYKKKKVSFFISIFIQLIISQHFSFRVISEMISAAVTLVFSSTYNWNKCICGSAVCILSFIVFMGLYYVFDVFLCNLKHIVISDFSKVCFSSMIYLCGSLCEKQHFCHLLLPKE